MKKLMKEEFMEGERRLDRFSLTIHKYSLFPVPVTHRSDTQFQLFTLLQTKLKSCCNTT